MQMTGLCLQVFGSGLQILGAGVTAYGLFRAWNRASGKFDQLLEDVQAWWANWRVQRARKREPYTTSFVVDVPPSLSMAADLDLSQTGTPEERLRRAENELATLPGRVDEAISAALREVVAVLKVERNAFEVRDIYAAMAGIAIAGIGVVVALVGLLI
ncbi:hypothetical protein NM962_12635 [Mycobacterium sp. SVM_VP21]|nr:hypothetical protein NM962_12635 [Mycobacterium sp. SVM_VP21]